MATRKQEMIESVEGHPAKYFFVSMLTRDIDLQDAILDLLDNCVDGAIRARSARMAAQDSLAGFYAAITFDEKKFVIEDNCGGMPWPIARDYAFKMGRAENIPTKPGTIGVVGIGMKRAIFKIGRECYVHSNHKDDAFMVTISPSWFEDDEIWNFDAKRESAGTNGHGTIIEIHRLEDGAKRDFRAGSSFRAQFATMVGETYSYLIEKGFKVTINGRTVLRKPVKLFFEEKTNLKKKGPLIRPYIFTGKIDTVDVFMAVGYRSRLLTEAEQEDEKEATFAAREAGWTIICNDRVVLSSDRTVKTGWGLPGVPNFHNQFRCIAGLVEFRSANTADLPITTTKRGVDTSKDLYTLTRARMQEGLRHFTRNTNRWKGYESELRDRFKELNFLDFREIKELAEKLPMRSLASNGIQKPKLYMPDLPGRVETRTVKRISYTKPIAEIERVSKYLFEESRSPSEVGEVCFDRFLKEAQ